MEQLVDLRTANVYGVYGHLGGGKTLSSVASMIDLLREGHTVVSNVLLRNIEGLKGDYRYIEDFSAIDFWKLPCGAPRGSKSKYRVMICIDECAEFLDQYSSSSPFTKSFCSWLRHSSKRGQIVLLIIQRPEFLVKSVRLLVNKWIVCDDMAQLNLGFLRIRNPFFNDCIRRILIDRFGNILSRGTNMINKFEYGKYYFTAQSIATEGKQADQGINEFEDQIDISFFVLILLLIYAFLKYYFF